jgi:hypothetical protein
VVEQPVDVSSRQVPPTRAAVIELDAGGEQLGLKTSQFDMEDGHAVVTWIVDGKLSAGRKRFFRIIFEQEGVAASERIGVGKDEDALVVHGTGFTLRHDLRRAGAMVAATVAGVGVELKPNDLVCDPQLNHYMPDNKGAQVRVLARGPLRTAIEVRASYYRAAGEPFKMSVEDRADAPDMAPISKPRVTYRYTTVLGMPVTRIDAFMIQDTPHPWREVEVGMFTFDRAFHNWALSTGDIATGKTTGVLAKKGLWHESGNWAAVHDRDFLIGIASATGVGILDMKEPRPAELGAQDHQPCPGPRASGPAAPWPGDPRYRSARRLV